MSEIIHDSDIGRRRRERAVSAIERIEGVLAATVQLGAGTRIDGVRIAIGPGTQAEPLRGRALAVLRELGYEVDDGAVHAAPIGGNGAHGTHVPAATAAPAATTQQGTTPQQDARTTGAPAPQSAQQTKQTPSDGPPAGAAPPESIAALLADQGPPPAWHGRFLVLDGVDVRRSDARVTVTVRLRRLGESFSGEVQELDTPQGRARAAARAALLAAEKAGEGVGLALEGVVIQEFFGREYVLAFVDGVAHRRFASLCGILNVEQSLETAAALAILRAVERWVAW